MKSYIWTLPTRLFHLFLAISFAAAYILADFDELRSFHFAFGAFVGALIFLRLFYGLFGPKYSNFRDFPIGIGHQIRFLSTFFAKTKVYAGHNPAAALVMLFIFIVGIGCSISGYLLYAKENNVLTLSIGKEFFKEAHEITANLFLALVLLHLLGVVVDLVFHSKNETLKSIFTGYKNIESINVKLNGFQKRYSVIWFLIPLIFFYLAFGLQTKKQEKSNHKSEQTEKHEDVEDDD